MIAGYYRLLVEELCEAARDFLTGVTNLATAQKTNTRETQLFAPTKVNLLREVFDRPPPWTSLMPDGLNNEHLDLVFPHTTFFPVSISHNFFIDSFD